MKFGRRLLSTMNRQRRFLRLVTVVWLVALVGVACDTDEGEGVTPQETTPTVALTTPETTPTVGSTAPGAPTDEKPVESSVDDDLLVISGPITLGEHRIAFTRYGYSDLDVLIVDVDGGNERPLTDQVGSSDPVWSPDGTRIAFTGKRYGFYGYSEIYLVDADGGNLEQLHQPSL